MILKKVANLRSPCILTLVLSMGKTLCHRFRSMLPSLTASLAVPLLSLSRSTQEYSLTQSCDDGHDGDEVDVPILAEVWMVPLTEVSMAVTPPPESDMPATSRGRKEKKSRLALCAQPEMNFFFVARNRRRQVLPRCAPIKATLALFFVVVSTLRSSLRARRLKVRNMRV